MDLASTRIAEIFGGQWKMDLASTGFAGSFGGWFGSVLDCCSCRDRKRAEVAVWLFWSL